MKIRPVILCGGAGTRLWPNYKNHQPKQFIDFGNWSLFGRTLDRINNPLFDYPIISTNSRYIKAIKSHLRKYKIKNYKIVIEPEKKNTAPAILTSTLMTIDDNNFDTPLLFLSADHFINSHQNFYKEIKENLQNLNNENIFIFGAKPSFPSSQYGYFLLKKDKNTNKVSKFIEKPNISKAKAIIKKKAYWNTGIFLMRSSSVIYNFKKFCPNIFKVSLKSIPKKNNKKKVLPLIKKEFKKLPAISFDYAILEKATNIYGIKLNIEWSDLGSWPEILKLFKKLKLKYYSKKNLYHRPWGSYINLFYGKNFLIKELLIKPKSSISLQKHLHRSEHWLVTSGEPIITIGKKKFQKKINDTVIIPVGTIHRIENEKSMPVKIMEVQLGSILKESDIIRYKDIYGRVR
ncbi:MAG: mannose-6-phosphate isomerase [Pelagibacteraceae bacterium TMED216]|nr:MAG: mannose-6-phosphate isomerase [Pelagibacteraceae bacterium TMED216]|tara:strand:+ start:459 stop:1667 length:1209 start_codon:yes stop_codon:yes gene_type:complete